MRLAIALLALAAAPVAAFTTAPNHQARTIQQRTCASSSVNTFVVITTSINSALSMATATEVDAQAVIDDTLKAAGSGVALFGKSGCPFCKKTKKALYGIGVHPTIVELDEVEGGASIQKKLVMTHLIMS